MQAGEGPGLDGLLAGGIHAVHFGVEFVLEEARAAGPVVAAHQLDQLCPEAVPDMAGDHHAQAVAGRDGQRIRVRGDGLGIHGLCRAAAVL